MTALKTQVGGSHYKDYAIQPAEFCQRNRIPYCEANVIKYVIRHRKKNGADDIRKAIHYLEMLLEMEYSGVPKPRAISEVCGLPPGSFAKHLDEQRKAGGPEAHAMQQISDAGDKPEAKNNFDAPKLREELQAAEGALLRSGFTRCDGPARWKPPVGRMREIDAINLKEMTAAFEWTLKLYENSSPIAIAVANMGRECVVSKAREAIRTAKESLHKFEKGRPSGLTTKDEYFRSKGEPGPTEERRIREKNRLQAEAHSRAGEKQGKYYIPEWVMDDLRGDAGS